MRRLLFCIVVVVWSCVSPASGKAVIKVVDDAYDADTIMEGTREAVIHTFVVRNTGDEPLQIKAVRPG